MCVRRADKAHMLLHVVGRCVARSAGIVHARHICVCVDGKWHAERRVVKSAEGAEEKKPRHKADGSCGRLGFWSATYDRNAQGRVDSQEVRRRFGQLFEQVRIRRT